jgi:transposase-like protein
MRKFLHFSASLLSFFYIFGKFTPLKKCPHCGEKYSVERIHRSWFAKKLIFFTTSQAYRCQKCRKTFLQLGKLKDERQQLVFTPTRSLV